MAGEIFISYRRADAVWARLLYDQLRAEGIEAWYDALVGAGQDWRLATAKALEDSQIFVLLFSENAAQSSDIAKELAAAVLEKKLIVPIRLQNIAPKGAFLYELASRNWINAYDDTQARLTEVARSLAQLVRTGAKDVSVLPFAPAAQSGALAGARMPLLVGAVGLVLAIVAMGVYWIMPKQSQPPAAATRVAVLPFDNLSDGAQAGHLADALTEEIATRLNSNRIQVVSRGDAATLRGADRDRKVADLGVALLLDGTVEAAGSGVNVRIHLDDPRRHVTLWSGAADGPADRTDLLRAKIASTAVAVLACSNRALSPVHGLSDPDLLSRYLHACEVFVNGLYSRQAIYELFTALREVSAKAPDFTPAHSDFAKFALYFSAILPAEQAAPLRKEGEDEAHKALALDPKSPDAHLALSWVLPPTDWSGREKLLRQGVSGDPNWPHTNGFLGEFLAETGRLQEAAIYLQRAASADLQIDWAPQNAWLQCGSGQFEGINFLMDAIKKKPGDPYIWGILRQCMMFARRFADMRALNRDSALRPAYFSLPAVSAKEDIYLAAGETGKPADVAKARDLALSAPGGPNSETRNAIQQLSALGLLDDAFDMARRYTPGAALTGADSAFLFYPFTAAMRRDPRFLQLAARLGLMDYWRASGKWPDFCADPGLPYNCRTAKD